MSRVPETLAQTSPRIGFVSLGCPKALVDSERILTQLRIEGYQVVGGYGEADLVVVNTCGFIEAAQQESLDAIGEALTENGKVIVTGCLGMRDAFRVALNNGAGAGQSVFHLHLHILGGRPLKWPPG